jgi:hypothetical protein
MHLFQCIPTKIIFAFGSPILARSQIRKTLGSYGTQSVNTTSCALKQYQYHLSDFPQLPPGIHRKSFKTMHFSFDKSPYLGDDVE